MSDYFAQTPAMTLLEICDLLWRRGEFVAYRALRAYITERDAMLKRLAEQSSVD